MTAAVQAGLKDSGLGCRVLLKAGHRVIRRHPVTGRAGPAGGIHREPAGVFHAARFNKHLAGELIDESEHLAAAGGAKPTVHVGTVKTARGEGLVLALDTDGVLGKHDDGSLAGSGDALAVFAMAVEPHRNLRLVKLVLDAAAQTMTFLHVELHSYGSEDLYSISLNSLGNA